MNRRDFLRRAGIAGGALACAPSLGGLPANTQSIAIVLDPSDEIASNPSVQWAARDLQQALADAGVTVHRHNRAEQAEARELCIVGAGTSSAVARSALKSAGIAAPSVSESLALCAAKIGGHPSVLASGFDSRGVVYALLELADRIRCGAAPEAALKIDKLIVERPTNPVRSVMRQFTSETLDKPWFYDRDMWPNYLAMLATHRFNRLHLGFGFGYDTLSQVADSYLLFLYPFLLSVPGYNVRATNLSDAERDRNLETLRFISEQTVAHGLEFQLGVWMHGYQLTNSPRAQHTITGLNADNHASYCRDALTAVLQACPAISAVALRIHGESGVAEGSYDFWRTIFDGVKRCGRKVEIDLHAKGIDATMIDSALDTGMPVNLSPKFWAEHLGMPYHQSAIRDLEMPVEGKTGAGLMTLSEGSRVFTRYGYADLLRDDRKYTVRHRVFAGTQKILAWGDPDSTAFYSRSFQFCDSTGADLMEPLTTRGRRGTGVPGNRSGYTDARMEPKWDWQKYSYWYRTWGRKMYHAESNPEECHREFGVDPKARLLESALSRASRILPMITTAHLPSAACDAYWPELYWNHPIAGEARGNPYGDTPSPKTFPYVSPLDPQLFSRMSDFAEELIRGKRSGKYSPIEVAQWLEDLTANTEMALTQAGRFESPQLSRIAIDVEMQLGLGRFFAAKFRAGVFYAIFEQTADRRALEGALKFYRMARENWVRLAERAKPVYAVDLSASDKVSGRGQWSDRFAGIDQDIARMEQQLATAKISSNIQVVSAILEVSERPVRSSINVSHKPPTGFRAKTDVALKISVGSGRKLAAAQMFYRHVNQAKRFESVAMMPNGNDYSASIPASYTDSPFPLQYYFELREGPEKVTLFPGLSANPSSSPYFVLRRI